MSAEIRRSATAVWTVCVACGLEEPQPDAITAGLAADEHNESLHPPRIADDALASRGSDLEHPFTQQNPTRERAA